MRTIYELIAGDILYRLKSGVWHWGVYLGNDRVLHNSRNNGEHVSSLKDFSSGENINVIRPSNEKQQAILQRASQIAANPKRYSYLWRNCEHTIYQIVEGKPRSPTANIAIGLAFIATGVIAYKYRKQIFKAMRSAA